MQSTICAASFLVIMVTESLTMRTPIEPLLIINFYLCCTEPIVELLQQSITQTHIPLDTQTHSATVLTVNYFQLNRDTGSIIFRLAAERIKHSVQFVDFLVFWQ